MPVGEPDQTESAHAKLMCRYNATSAKGARAWDKILKQRIKTLMFVRVHHSPHDLPSYSTVCFLSRPVNAYVTRHVTGVIQSV